MKLIFWGLIFLFFDFKINFGNSTISFLPGFVGYALIWKGMRQVDCGAYISAKPWVVTGIVYTAVIWVLNCLGILAHLTAVGVVSIMLTVAGSVIELGVIWWITKGVCELETRCEFDMHGRKLKKAWTILLVMAIVLLAATLLNRPVISLVVLIVYVIFMIYYLVWFHRCRKAYEVLAGQPEEKNEPSNYL